nr:uncharacterized protein LOC127316169 [Lolium perenne]
MTKYHLGESFKKEAAPEAVAIAGLGQLQAGQPPRTRPPPFPQPPSPPRSPHPPQPWTAPPADLRAPAEDHHHELLRATPTRPWEGRHWPGPPPWPTNVGELQPLQVLAENAQHRTPRSPAQSSTFVRATTPKKPASSRRHHLDPPRGPSRPGSGPDGPLRPPAPAPDDRAAAARRAQPPRPPPRRAVPLQTAAATNAPPPSARGRRPDVRAPPHAATGGPPPPFGNGARRHRGNGRRQRRQGGGAERPAAGGARVSPEPPEEGDAGGCSY